MATGELRLEPNDVPAARAVVISMWTEARRQWEASLAPSTPPPASQPPAGTAAGPARPDQVDARAPKTFPQWAQRVDAYNAVLIDGQRRRFPELLLLGAETVLARLYHEHTVTKLYTPLQLGEILAVRTFAAGGSLNPLAIDRRTPASGTQALQATAGEAPQEESKWEPRSLIAILDGVDAARWAWILTGLTTEHAAHDFADWFTNRLRQRPQSLEALKDYWLVMGWRTAMRMRSGLTFAEATQEIMADTAALQDALSAPPKTPPARQRRDTPPKRPTKRWRRDQQWEDDDDQAEKGSPKGKGKKGAKNQPKHQRTDAWQTWHGQEKQSDWSKRRDWRQTESDHGQ